jgi:hypothetical protein
MNNLEDNSNNPNNNPNKIGKKPKITYDDILNSLNLKVNNGKLEFIPNSSSNQTNQSSSSSSSCSIPNSHYNQFKTCYRKQCNITKNNNNNNLNNNNNSLYQNSYIVNKYFKDYKENNIQETPREPIFVTKEEYKRLLILELIRKKEEQKRISQIKSKKLLFARNNSNAPTNASPNNLNKLFMFKKV